MLAPARAAFCQCLRVSCSSPAKKTKSTRVEGVGLDALDEADLVADGFEAAELGLVIHEQEIGCGKRRVGERVVEFFAAQRSCADDGDF